MGIEKRVDTLHRQFAITLPTDGTRVFLDYHKAGVNGHSKETIVLEYDPVINTSWNEHLLPKRRSVCRLAVTPDNWLYRTGEQNGKEDPNFEVGRDEIQASDLNPILLSEIKRINDEEVQKAAGRLIPGYHRILATYTPATAGR